MPQYVIRHTAGTHGDIHLEDPDLTIHTTREWVRFSDDAGLCLAVPREQVASVQRIDEHPQDQPAEE